METKLLEWIDLLPNGWHKLYRQMVNDLVKLDLPENFDFNDVKEKYGNLRVYPNMVVERVVIDTILKYEHLSQYVCLKCGKSANRLDEMRSINVCDSCFQRNKSPYGTFITPNFIKEIYTSNETRRLDCSDEWNRLMKGN